MSLPPVLYRDIGEEVDASDRLIYRSFMRHLGWHGGVRITSTRAILRASRDCGVPVSRVLEVLRAHGLPANLLPSQR